MAFTSFLCFLVIFSFVQAKGRIDSTCPETFSCGYGLTDLSFPFSLSTQPDCGIMLLSGCDTNDPRIQLVPGGDWYYAKGVPYNFTLLLVDPKRQTALRENMCQVYNQSISLPESPSISFKLMKMNTFDFIKCDTASSNTINSTVIRLTKMQRYDGCKGFSLYYKLPGDIVGNVPAGTFPRNCSTITLPVDKTSYHGNDSLMLTPDFYVEWKLSDECNQCHFAGGQCQTDKTNKFYCHKDVSNLTAGTSKRGHLRKIWIIVATGVVFSAVAVLILLFFFREKILWYKYIRFWEYNAEDHQNIEAFLKNNGSYAPKRYNYLEVKRITGHFKNKLGQGGFGYVYKGTLPNGSDVAVKVLNGQKGSGEDFINEVASISRTSHVNIVSLVGFCFEGRKRALIYEFMPNGSLEKFIYEEKSDNIRQLGWPVLYKIALGIARGLEYLHRGCNTRILHFDIKPHNILLDEDFCPKISDFGLAKLCMKKESIVSMLGARGTIGYIAPEIVCRNLGGVSHKSDVYSYGMMVLEMVGGRKNVEIGVDRTSEIYFPHWLYQRVEQDEELQLIGLMNEEDKECSRKMVIMSLWCIQTDPTNRPSMTKVVEMLEGNLDSLQIPPKPYLYSPSRSEVDSSIIELA